ncbi:cytochrome and DOMON domain-containing protein [Sesamum alatum]|uniref:Cytochrome and DOMON domain-containing protein n=1 Tax=Sesamum alatum TaxID=300844 RepID=A0AAE2CZL8_9LAMI|nr:cytochrome and DOMON domain-containing protein [Sesamum alatum]
MAASSFLLIAAAALLVCPALSLTCTSQTFSENTKFANCTDLPTLKAFLHWTYDPTAKPKPTLSIAFIAPPAKSDGWIAWALNPTASGMVGAQSLIAFKDTNGSVVVKTYNVSEYGPVSESKISYEVLNKRAESSHGEMRIFATLALPSGSAELNQVWQVGASVKDGVPAKHEFSPENLSAKSKLQLVGHAAEKGGSPAPAPTFVPESAPTSVPSAGGPSGNNSGGSSRVWGIGLGLYGALVVLVVSIFVF